LERKTFILNFTSLALIQGTNFLLPLLLLPYLVSVLGMNNFGLISLAQAFVSYFIIITDYGFNITATREISQNRNQSSKLSEEVSRIIVTKFFLSAISFCMLVIVVSLVPGFSKNKLLYYLSFSMVLGQLLLPTWFFQGIEKMVYLTYLNLAGKISFTLLIILFIRQPQQYVYVNLLYGLGNMVSGIAGLWLMVKKFDIKFIIPGNFLLKTEIKKGWNVFISNFAINAYLNSNILILGFFVNEVILGYYSIAEKIILAFRQLLNVFFQSTYPQICQKALAGHKAIMQFFRLFFIPFLGVVIILSCILLLTAPHVTLLLAGKSIPQITQSIMLLSIVPIIVCLNIPAYQTLLAYDFQKGYMPVLLLGCFLNILLNLWLAGKWGMWGTIWSVIITEIFITAGLHISLQMNYPKQSLFNRLPS
jgi:polysaccharide transporter, PST family